MTTDLKNSSFRILDLDQPGLGMAREYLMKGLGEPDVQVSIHIKTKIITWFTSTLRIFTLFFQTEKNSWTVAITYYYRQTAIIIYSRRNVSPQGKTQTL